jgi:hypothetical protein
MYRSSLVEKAFLALLCALVASGTAAAHGRDPHARVAAQNGWLTSLRVAKEKAEKTGKPIMVVLRCFD